ncbi:MAG: hypothetical protein WBW47_05195 [Thermoplasmata archaeon]
MRPVEADVNRRVLISIANLVAIAIAFVILFEYPQYSNDAFYLLVIWMVVGFVLLYAMRPRLASAPANAPGDSSPFPSSPGANAPLPSGSPSGGSIGFCIYCAAPVAPGTRACPACGHALPGW